MRTCALLFAALMFPAYAAAENDTPPPMPLEDQEQMELLNNGVAAIKGLEAATEAATVQKKNECMKAIGNVEFCDCIAEKSPVGVNFIGYVSITASTKEDFKYDQLSPEDKKLFDATRASRDKCVDWKGKATSAKP